MSDKITFDYHYGRESSQYHYYQIPQILIKDCYFKNLSTDAKLLYGIMLNRMKLSQKKGWLDDESRVFIYFTVEEVKEELNCGKNKAINLLAELDVKKGFGLIERKRQGMGKPDLIYVRHFARAINETGDSNANEDFPEHEEDDSPEDTEDCDSDISDEFSPGFGKQTSRGLEIKPQEVWKSNLKKFENQTSGSLESKPQEVSKANLKKFENQTSAGLESKPPTLNSNHDVSNPDFSKKEDISIYPSLVPVESRPQQIDRMDSSPICLVREQISYEGLCSSYRPKRIDEIVEIIVEIMTAKKAEITISGESRSLSAVQSRFSKLTYDHIDYVLRSLEDASTDIRNIRAYLLASLFNAPTTMENYYSAGMQHSIFS